MFGTKPESVKKILAHYCMCNGKVPFYNNAKPMRCMNCRKYTYGQYLQECKKQYARKVRLMKAERLAKMKAYEYERQHAYA